ncbi:hypothetical protein FJY84_04840 [Candidatus Bathyarchaeota archaeon]|nr:hypothetical protein [Candidatus Bathyarchaeota archaeon]
MNIMSALSKMKSIAILPILLGLILLIIGGFVTFYSYNLNGTPRVFWPIGMLVAISGVIVIISMER